MLTGSAGHFAIRYGLVRKALDTQAVFDELYAASPASFWLDSSVAGAGPALFSFLGDDQGPLSEMLIRCGGAVTVRDRRGIRAEPGDILALLDARLAERRIGATCLPFEFVGGYVGYFSPARAPGRDVVPTAEASQAPDAMWMFADRIVAVDHQSELTYVLAVEDGRAGVRAAADAWIVDTMRRMQGLPSQHAAAEPAPTPSALVGLLAADGYRQLRRSHPAPYSALLSFGEAVLLSCASGNVLRAGAPGARLAATTPARQLAPATGAEPLLVSATDALRRCLLAAMVAGVASEPLIELSAGLDPARRPTGLGYFGLAGGADLTLVTPVAVPRAAARSRHSAEPLVGAAEPAA